MTDDLASRLRAAADNWPNVYESDRRNIDMLREAAQCIRSQQARIDALMLEFCPERMSAQQQMKWAAHQRPVRHEFHAPKRREAE